MTLYNPGDVVLVRFPFTDLSTTKKRPALVISPAGFTAKNGDLVVLDWSVPNRRFPSASKLEKCRIAEAYLVQAFDWNAGGRTGQAFFGKAGNQGSGPRQDGHPQANRARISVIIP
jgi:hypothetical protein